MSNGEFVGQVTIHRCNNVPMTIVTFKTGNHTKFVVLWPFGIKVIDNVNTMAIWKSKIDMGMRIWRKNHWKMPSIRYLYQLGQLQDWLYSQVDWMTWPRSLRFLHMRNKHRTEPIRDWWNL
jgi:hypothetical protein